MKSDRHAQILRLIREHDIETQEELALKLQESGYAVTQATVSRDIRALKLTKVATDSGGVRYALMQQRRGDEEGKYVRVLADAVVSMEAADSLLVVRTASGMAMAAAAVLDELHLPELVGCIAGDNTIFCATRGRDACASLEDRLQSMLERFRGA